MSPDKIPAPWGGAKPAGTPVIAITGTIAAGKSTLGKILAEKGWKVIDADEIVHRLVLSLVNEAAKILEEGIASKASDIDMVYLTGYGFPLWRGGPMCYADSLGLFNAVQMMKRFAANPHDDASFWEPAPLLKKLVAEGKSLT